METNVTDIASSPEINALRFNRKIIVDINNIGDYKDESNPNIEEAKERHKKLKDFLQAQGW